MQGAHPMPGQTAPFAVATIGMILARTRSIWAFCNEADVPNVSADVC